MPAARLKCRATLKALCHRINVAGDTIMIDVTRSALQEKLGLKIIDKEENHESPLTISVPVKLQRRGVETKLIIQADGIGTRSPDANLITLIANARSWWQQLCNGDVDTIKEIADRVSMDAGDVSRILPLAFLSPKIVATILDGRQPVTLTAKALKRTGNLPLDWTAQAEYLGFGP